MKKLLLLIISIIVLNAFVIAQNSWTQMSCMYDYGRYEAISFTINGKAYVGLGQIPDGTKVYDFWEYDPSANTWTKKADYPGGGGYAATAFAINGKGYVCLGANNSGTCKNDLWEYSPGTNTWLQKANFPGAARYGATCFVIGDTAFVGTGSYGSSSNYMFDMWMYVPSSNSWSQKADFPGNKRSCATAFTIGNFGYLGTGLSGSLTATSDIWKYDKSNNSWTSIPNLPGLPRAAIISFVINNKAYLGTGNNFISSSINNYNDFYAYDPLTNSWGSLISAPNDVRTRRYATGFSINNIGYLGTGYTDNGLLPDLWAFNPNSSSGIIEKNSIIDFKLYPNPATDNITIENTQKAVVEISNIEGQIIKNTNTNEKHTTIDISAFPSGVYFVKVIPIAIGTEKGIEVRKFVKE